MMRIKALVVVLLISLLNINIMANDNKKKKPNFTTNLSIPSTLDEIKNTKLNIISLWEDAKHGPISALNIGYIYLDNLHNYKKAFEWFRYSDSMLPLGEDSYFACYSLQQLKRYDEAISWCKKAIKLKWNKALFLLGTVYEDYGNYNKAIEYYKKSFEKVKEKMAANNLGYLYSTKIKDYKKAEDWYKKAIRSNDYPAYQGIANLYHEKLNDDIKASAYAIALINTKYTKSSVLEVLKNEMKIPNEIIKKGYELQLKSPAFPIRFKGNLALISK